mmetsp:Transcript_19849/g.45499  ORF Transcript_19849/g.45499 Transcript_19849/m.45499 type:complete len:248 (-) Transcript_19849:29-772(-)
MVTADNLRQRRGKKDGAGVTGGSTSADGATSTAAEVTPIQQLRDAHARLVLSRERTAELHHSWRNQLLRVSLLVIFISLHQLQSCIGSCLREIKGFNQSTADGKISGARAIQTVFGMYFYEVLGVVISFLLALFLGTRKDSKRDLDHWSYLMCSALVPVCLGFYFQSQDVGCMEEATPEEETAKRQFPAVVIYHTITTLAFWFMQSGRDQCENHVKIVEESIRDFVRMDKKMELKRQKMKQAGRKER